MRVTAIHSERRASAHVRAAGWFARDKSGRARSRAARQATLFALALLSAATARAVEERSGDKGTKPIPVARIRHPAPVDFDAEVLPILKNNCLACHNKTAAKAKLVLETPDDMLKGSDSGPVIVPKKSGASLLLKAASHQLEDTIMPPPGNKARASDLTPEELGLIKLWIDQGAKGSTAIVRPIEWQPLPEGLNAIYAVAVTPDGQFAACARANQIFIYHLPSQRLAGRLTDPQLLKSGLYDKPGVAHRAVVHSLSFSPDGSLLASGAWREVKLWRRPKNVEQHRFASVARKSLTAIAVSPDGKWLATGGDDGRVKLRELATGKHARTLPTPTGVTARFHPQAAMKAGPRPITLPSPRPSRERSVPDMEVRSLKFSPDSAELCCVCGDNVLCVYDVPGGRITAQMPTGSEMNAIAWLADNQIAVGGADKAIHIWRFDASRRELAPLKELTAPEGTITALEPVPTTRGQILSGSSDGSVRLWDVEARKMIREMKHGGSVTAVAVRNDGHRFASGGTDKTTRLWDATDGKQIASLKGDRHAQEYAADRARALAFAKSEVEFYRTALKSAETNQTAQAERVRKATESGEAAEKALAEKQSQFLEATQARTAAENAWEELKAEVKTAEDAVAASDQAAKRAEAKAKSVNESAGQNKEALERLKADAAAKSKTMSDAKADAEKHAAQAKEKEKSAGEKLKSAAKALEEAEKELKRAEQTESNARTELRLATSASNDAVKGTAEAKTSIEKAEAEQKRSESELETAKTAAAESERTIRDLAFSPDGATLATVDGDGLVHTWSANDGAAFETYRARRGRAVAVAFGRDGNLVAGVDDRSVVVWDLRSDWALERVIGTGDASSPIVDRVNVVKFSPNGKALATGGGEPTRGGEIKLWEVATGRLTQSFTNVHSDAVFGLDFSPDGKFLASSAADKFMKVVELSTGNVVKQFEGHTHHVLGVSWNRDERTLASAGADNVIKLWDFITGERKKNIGGFDKEVTAVSFVGYSDEALAASGDGKLRLLKEDGNEVRSFPGAGDFIESTGVTADGKVVVAGGQDGVLRVWDGTNGELVISFPPPDAKQ